MQRSITNKRVVKPLLYVVIFILYNSLSSIYPLLPPLFAVLFVLFMRALKSNNTYYLLLVSFAMLIFEANHGYIFFSTIFYSYVAATFFLPKIEQSFNCYSCTRIMYVLAAYIGYYLFLTLFCEIFMLPHQDMDYYIAYYIIVEFFIVSII